MDASASIIDEMDHHPNWQQIDSEVDVQLNTHDIGNNISYKDILLARTLVKNLPFPLNLRRNRITLLS